MGFHLELASGVENILKKMLGNSYRNCHATVHASYVVSKLKCCTSKLFEFDFCFTLSGEHGVKFPFFILRIVLKTWLLFDPNVVLKVVQSYKELCMLYLNEMLVWNCTDSLLWKNQFAISKLNVLDAQFSSPNYFMFFPYSKTKGSWELITVLASAHGSFADILSGIR